MDPLFHAHGGGQRVSFETYRKHWLQGLRKFRDEAQILLPVQQLPTLTDLEQAFRRVSPGKAIGLDGIPPELCHHQPVPMARCTYAIMLKTALFGQEAFDHKGGKLAIAWKQKGDFRNCCTHRSLLVSSHVGKTVHRALRQKYNFLYNTYMQRQQLGGRPKMPVAIPLHMSRAFLRWKQRLKQPTALLFLDLTEAFYRTLRPLAVGDTISDHCISLMCHKLGFDSDTMHELYATLQQPSAVEEAHAPSHVQRLLQALHRDTWFQIGTQTDLVRTEIGSRPGDSFADVIFGFLFAKVLRQLEETLIAHDILELIPDIGLPQPYQYCASTGPVIPLLGPTWMDDLNILLTANSNHALVSKTQVAMSLLIDACREFQMEPNLQRGKTEVMFTFRGALSRVYRREFFTKEQSLQVVCEKTTHCISVVSRYVHLGGLLHHKDVTRQEIRRRLAIANQAFTQHRRLLYRNAKIAWKTRCDLFQTLILSKFTYGLETWTFCHHAARQQIHVGIMKLYRRLLGKPADAHLTDLDILVQTHLPDPTELLRRARLRYFGTLHNCQHHSHWGLLREDFEWVELIKDDLSWLWLQLHRSSDLQNPADHFSQWQDLIVHHGGYWKKLIRRGIEHACLQRLNEYQVIDFHCRIGHLLLNADLVPSIPCQITCAASLTAATRFGCMSCQRKFASYAGECVHMRKTHNIIAQERFLFDSTQCACCLKEFHTHTRILAHLRVSKRCKEILQGRRFHCAPLPGPGSRQDQDLTALADGAQVSLQASGPFLPSGVRRVADDHDIPFLEALYVFLLDLPTTSSLIESVRKFISSFPINWTKCQRTLQFLRGQLTQTDADVMAFSLAEINSCLNACANSDSWPFLTDSLSAPQSITHAGLQSWEEWYTSLATSVPADWIQYCPPPSSLTRYKILLHAFAGRRRRGDIEWFLDQLSSQHSGYTILPVSIDIIIDPEFGDISKQSTQSFWLHYIQLGFVAGFIAGPPCNTWSKARAHALADGRGPRVVRDPMNPWGLPSMRLAEVRQVLVGNILLGFSFVCIFALALHGGAALLEHPRDPEHDDTISIWRLPILNVLLQLPDVRLVHVAQGLFGAPSPKPTTLLALRLPTLETALHRGLLTGANPQAVSIGKNVDGTFRTSPLKEYPPGFCKAIATAFSDSFCTDLTCMDYSELPSAFLDLCYKMHNRAFGLYIGMD